MPKQASETSVKTVVSKLEVNQDHTFTDRSYNSVAVMVSNLKKEEQHKEKKFKVKRSQDGNTVVTRLI